MADITTLLSKFLTNLWAGNITSAVTDLVMRTSTTAADTLKIQAYDTDGASYTTLLTATAGTNPTLAVPALAAGATTGLYAGTVALARLFTAAAGAGGQSVGQNAFLAGAGNSTLTNGAGATSLASYNTGAGWTAIDSLTSGSYNTSVGWAAGTAITAGQGNTAVGALSLMADTTHNFNTAIGMSAGSASAADGITAIGYNALGGANTGAGNTAIGRSAMAANTSGYDNTSLGYLALTTNTAGHGNTAIGSSAMTAWNGAAADGSNTGVGYHALMALTDARYNTAVGSTALVSATGAGGAENAWGNTGIGHAALYSATTGAYNTAVGDYTLYSNVTGIGNVAIGRKAGYYETGSGAFYVDNQDRTNTAGDKAGALLYGTFNATPASQTLRVNASLSVLTIPAFVASDKYLVVDASGNIHVSATGPAS